MERTSGRRATGAREPRIPKPNISYVTVVCRGGGCAVKGLVLTRGGPWMRTHDNNDLDVLRSSGRRNDASRGVGRTHSSRKTRRRRPAWRHAERVKRSERTIKASSHKEGDRGGEGGNIQEGRRPNLCRNGRHRKGPQGPTRPWKEKATYKPSEVNGRNAEDPTRQPKGVRWIS